ncbi:MAG TPA: tRNA preQ1(34) S-adenosylmethionine ribosyltransferase-isomerase QueA [Caulobacteraceae bacterium]|nr:tRNA preQ1(34) S-adenosylmethionine ribosyltransferase-isomerase QueA [Caulobacteraceae bacterium]
MKIADFDFDLPEDRIALRPAHPRDAARMLEVSRDGSLIDRVVADLPQCLRVGDAVVFNDTKVIPARLMGIRSRQGLTARIEATLLKRVTESRWSAFVRPAKRLKPGDRVAFGERDDRACLLSRLDATVIERGEDGEATLEFDLSGAALDDAIAERGLMPLPPYIAGRRAEDEQDFTDYQTVFARLAGSVAAPTAGLHFTPELLQRLRKAEIACHFVTLHVGAGTFLPVKTEILAAHRMHAETGEVSAGVAEALNGTRAAGGRIVCVGTTSLRLIESAAGERGHVAPFSGETRLFIKPGYRFQVADALVTNFHLPRSTLFVLVCAFAGTPRMKAAYAHAVKAGYRFYSYGDASLIWRAR